MHILTIKNSYNLGINLIIDIFLILYNIYVISRN